MNDHEPPPSGAPHPARPLRSYVLRAGRMGSGQQRALKELGPHFVLPYAGAPMDAPAVFGRRAPLVLEIGFGMGQATAQIAAARPEIDFLGVEVHEPGVGALLRLIGEGGLSNLRIVRHDAVEVLQHMLAPASLHGVHIFFPIPGTRSGTTSGASSSRHSLNCWRADSHRAATCIARPTGSPTPTRCWRCCPRRRRCATPSRKVRAAMRRDRTTARSPSSNNAAFG